MASKDISTLIERLEAFEDRLGVRLEGLFAQVQIPPGSLIVNGELHLQESAELDEDIEVVVTIYDSSGRVIAVRNHRIRSESFFGFEAFSVVFFPFHGQPTRIRVYPKAR